MRRVGSPRWPPSTWDRQVLQQESTPASATSLTQASVSPLAAMLEHLANHRVGWAAAIILMCAYTTAFAAFSPLPLQDLPGHLARAVAMDDLIFHGGARFGGVFHYHFLFTPYLLGDLILTSAVGLLGLVAGSAFWSVFVFLALPCAVLFYLRVRGIAPDRRAFIVLLCLYLATDWFFVVGFMSFRLAVAVTLASLALAEPLRRNWSRARYATYICAVIVSYLTHLSTVAFLVAALGVTAILNLSRRATTLKVETLLAAPLAALLAWHFAAARTISEPGDFVANAYLWGTWYSKFARLGNEFIRYSPRTDAMMVVLLAACMFLIVGRPRVRDFRHPIVTEMLALSVTFVVMYFVLPIGYSEAWYVDIRPLPLASLFLVFACLAVPQSDSGGLTVRTSAAVLLAAVLAIVNLAYLTRHFVHDGQWIARYRAVVAAIPHRGRVLSIFSSGREGAIVPFMHVDSYATIDREATTPYVFAADNGNPMKYFRYVHRPYDPEQLWYGDVPPRTVDWTAVARDYDYLLLTEPFDLRRLGLRTNTVARNSSAMLLAIAR